MQDLRATMSALDEENAQLMARFEEMKLELSAESDKLDEDKKVRHLSSFTTTLYFC